jgi:PAS domain S-box-containing protein
MNAYTIILERNEGFQQTVKTVLARLGLIILTPVGIKQCREMVAAYRPGFILINFDVPGIQDLITEIRSGYPEIQILALAATGVRHEQTGRIKAFADDVILTPPDPHLLEISVKRAMAFGRLSRRLEKIEADVAGEARQRAERMIADERYVTVRQIVDETSIFIDKIVQEVQGDIPFFNQMPYFISIHGRDMRVLATNSTYRQFFGNQTSQPSWAIYTGKHASRETCPVGQTVGSITVLSTRARVQYSSGASIPVIVYTSPIYNNDGDLDLVLEVFAGIKETQDLAAEIRTTQQRYQRLFDAVPSHIAVLDREMRITAVNQRFKADFGDQTGHGFWTAFRQPDTALYDCPITQTIKDGEAHQAEMALTTRDGDVYNMMVWTAPIHTMQASCCRY